MRRPSVFDTRPGHRWTLICSGVMKPRLWLGHWSCDCGQSFQEFSPAERAS